MAELATIARPYAEALFKASGADLAAAEAWVDSLGTIAEDAQLLQFAANPKATVDQVFDLISAVVPTALPAPAQNFLRTVIGNGRLSVLPEIALQFRALKNAQSGSSVHELWFHAVKPAAAPMSTMLCQSKNLYSLRLHKERGSTHFSSTEITTISVLRSSLVPRNKWATL